MVNKVDNFDRYEKTEKQIAAIAENRMKSQEVRRINDERTELARSLKSAAEFNDDEKQSYFDTLSNEIDETDITAVREFKRQVGKDRQDIRHMIDQYTGIINQNRDAFGADKNKNYNAADEYISEFMELDMEGKREWLRVIESDINERLELLRRAKELMPDSDDYLHTLKRSKVKDLVKELEKSDNYVRQGEKLLADNEGCFSESEKEELKEQLGDSTRHDQARILNDLRTSLPERKKMAEAHKAMPAEYRGLAGKFEQMSVEEKRVALKEIETRVTKNFRDLQRNHPLAVHISEQSKDDGFAFFKTMELKDKFKAVGQLENMFKTEKQLSDKFEKLLASMDEDVPQHEKDGLKLAFYEATYDQKKDRLIPSLEKSIAKAKESKDANNETLTGQYKSKLEDALKEKRIGKKTMKRALDVWKKKTMEEKASLLGKFERDMAPRIALLERFEKLPDEIKEPNKEFYEAGFKHRLAIMADIEKELENSETPAQKMAQKGEKASENEKTEELGQKNIDNLTQLATRAERDEDYESALDFYKQILKLDPHDVIASSRLSFVRSRMKTAEKTDDDAKETSDGRAEKDMIAEATKSQAVEDDRKLYTIIKDSADETRASEGEHGTLDASKRQKDAEDKEIAEALDEYTEGKSVLNSDGEAEEIVEINVDEQMNTEKKAWLRREVIEDMKTPGNKAIKRYQFRNMSGQKLNASAGQDKADQIEQRIEDRIHNNVVSMAEKRGVKIDEETLAKDLEEKDFRKRYMAA